MAHRSGSADRRSPAAAAATATTVVTQLLNALAACDVERGLIVVDDAHRISDAAVFEFLDLLLERLPPQWGVVRREPDRPAAGLAARGCARTASSPSSASASCASRSTRCARCCRRRRSAARPRGDEPSGCSSAPTAGRSACAWRSTASSRGHDAQAVIADTRQRPPRLRLPAERGARRAAGRRCAASCCAARCSSELTAGRCAAVSADPRAAEWLEEIERRGLFVSVLQGAETTLRLHDLFRDFLRDRLRREMADELPTLLPARRRRRDRHAAPDRLPDRRGRLERGRGDARATPARRSSPPSASRRCCACSTSFPPRRMRSSADAAAHALPRRVVALGLADDARGRPPRPRRVRARRASRAWPGARASTKRSRYVTVGSHDEALQRLARRSAESTVTRDDLALAGVVAQLHRPRQRPARRASRRAMARCVDLLEPSRDPVLWYQCVPRSLQCGMPAMREPSRRFAAGALAVAPEAADAAAGDRAGDARRGATSGRASSTRRSRPPGSPRPTRAGSARRPTSALALYSRARRSCSRCSAGAADSDERARRAARTLRRPGRGYRRDSSVYAFYSPVRGPPRRLARRRRARARLVGEVARRSAAADTRRCGRSLAAQRAGAARRGSPGTRPVATRRATPIAEALAHDDALRVFGADAEVRAAPRAACSCACGDVDDAAAAVVPVFDDRRARRRPGAARSPARAANLDALAGAPGKVGSPGARSRPCARWAALLPRRRRPPPRSTGRREQRRRAAAAAPPVLVAARRSARASSRC